MMQKIYRTIKSILDPFRYKSLEDKDPPVNFSSIDKEMIYHATESVMDPFKYKSLEDKDAPTNFSLINFINNNTGTHLVAFPGLGWLFPPFLPELCTVCF